MAYEDFSSLTRKVQNFQVTKKVAVVAPEDEHSLEAVLKAKQEHIADPILIGNTAKISSVLDQLGGSVSQEALFHVENPTEAAVKAVTLVSEGKADFLMKGKVDTAVLMKVVVNKEYGLRTGKLMSHVAFLEIPRYHKLLAVTDGGINLYPHLEEKKTILENAVRLMRNMGYETPKVAVVAAVEKVNPKMQETLDAAELKHQNAEGVITHCMVEGPISLDLSVHKESAEIKGFHSPVAGDADMLLVPTIATGNIVAKSMIYLGGAKMAGVVVGAKVPIVLTSRGSSTEEKFLSLVLSAASV